MKSLILVLSLLGFLPLANANADTEALARDAQAAMSAKDYPAAITLYEQLVAIDPANSENMRMLGSANGLQASEASMFSAMKYARRSKAAFEKAVELDPENPKAVFALFSYLSSAPKIAGGDMQAAKVLADRLETLSPELALQAREKLQNR